jgi:hypothetical protein
MRAQTLLHLTTSLKSHNSIQTQTPPSNPNYLSKLILFLKTLGLPGFEPVLTDTRLSALTSEVGNHLNDIILYFLLSAIMQIVTLEIVFYLNAKIQRTSFFCFRESSVVFAIIILQNSSILKINQGIPA